MSWRRRQLDLLRDFARAIHLDDTARAALDHEHPAIGQGLAGVDFRLLRCLVFPDGLFVRRHFERSARVAEKIIPVGQPPAVLRMLACMLPLDFSVGRHHAYFARVSIRAEERVIGSHWRTAGQDRQHGATQEKGFHGLKL